MVVVVVAVRGVTSRRLQRERRLVPDCLEVRVERRCFLIENSHNSKWWYLGISGTGIYNKILDVDRPVPRLFRGGF